MGGPLSRPLGSFTNALPSSLTRYVLVSIGASPRHLFLHLLENLGQAVGRRGLQRRVRPVGLEFLQPQRLADGNDVPVVDVGGHGSRKCAALAQEGFRFETDGPLEGIPLDVVDQRPMEGMDPHQTTGRGLGCHREVDLPVLVAHCRRNRASVVEERIARRFLRLAGQIVELVDPLELGLDDAGIFARHDLLVEVVALGPPAISTKVGIQS